MLVPVEPIPDRLDLDVRHDVVEEAIGLTRVVERQDVGMIEAGGGFDLAQKPFRPERGREIRPQHLDRDPATMLQVLSEVQRRHPTAPELTRYSATPGQGGLTAGAR